MSITKANVTLTENGALTYNSTGSACLNLFARIGGLRNADEKEIVRLYLEARGEDKELADNMVLYARSIRDGGIGERRVGRILLKTLALKDPAKVRRNLDTIVNAGRWDDLYVLENTEVEKDMFAFLENQFKSDIIDYNNGTSISLLSKWLPSVNASSVETRRKARKTCMYFGITEKSYRKTLSKLRAYSNVVEVKMSSQNWSAINYSAVPSRATMIYRNAFARHDNERYLQWINAVKNGEQKINSSVLYPYDIAENYIRNNFAADAVLEEQWKALPNYVEGQHDVVVMADVSESMCGRPMATSTSLAAYFAERNSGPYKDLVVTFTDKPTFFNLDPSMPINKRLSSLFEHKGYNTNLDGALEAIYNKAVECNATPKALVVISDGEIDYFVSRIGKEGIEDLVEKWQRKYANAGLVAPKIIMWNVESRNNDYLSTFANPGISFVSGSSTSTFKELTNLIQYSAVEAMVKILSNPAFQWK